jgi:hypothetical protein
MIYDDDVKEIKDELLILKKRIDAILKYIERVLNR